MGRPPPDPAGRAPTGADTAPPARRGGPGRPGAGRPVEPSAHRLYVHVAWHTLNRLPLVGPRTALALESELISLCRRLDAEPVEVSVEADRVHVLARFRPNQCLGELVGRLKVGAAEAARRRASPVRWGRGWAATTVAPAEVRDRKRRLAGRSVGLPELTPGLAET